MSEVKPLGPNVTAGVVPHNNIATGTPPQSTAVSSAEKAAALAAQTAQPSTKVDKTVHGPQSKKAHGSGSGGAPPSASLAGTSVVFNPATGAYETRIEPLDDSPEKPA